MAIGLRIYGQVIVIVERRHSILCWRCSESEIAVRGEESDPAQASPGRAAQPSQHPSLPKKLPACSAVLARAGRPIR